MTKTHDYLRDARIHMLISAAFGWTWILGTLAGVIWIAAAILGDFSWMVTIGLVLGAQFAKAVAREYQRASRRAIDDGIAAGQIVVDGDGNAVAR